MCKKSKKEKHSCVSGQARTGDLPRPTGRTRMLGGRDNHYTTETTDKSQRLYKYHIKLGY